MRFVMSNSICEVTPPCRGLFGWLFGHKYEEIYDEVYGNAVIPDPSVLIHKCIDEGVQDIIESTKPYKQTYVHSICCRCGDVVNKSPSRLLVCPRCGEVVTFDKKDFVV